MRNLGVHPASKFEVSADIIVIAKAAYSLAMVTDISLINIEEEQQKINYATVKQIEKIMRFLRDIED